MSQCVWGVGGRCTNEATEWDAALEEMRHV
jgi:hypothetical protein